jgi:hypothetical protein
LQFSSAKKIEHISIAAISTTPHDIANNDETYTSDFACVHQTLLVTPAMEAGFQITSGHWSKMLVLALILSRFGFRLAVKR